MDCLNFTRFIRRIVRKQETLEAFLVSTVAVFLYIPNLFLFNYVYKWSPMVIDEEFHIPQGIKYCNLDFDSYDPKITTFPGLYIVSALFLAPLGKCTTYNLRHVNVVATSVNFVLFYYIVKRNFNQVDIRIFLTALNMMLLPPLYFFSHVYYTDVLSITFVMAMFGCGLYGNHWLAAIFGAMSILMRQTNVLWIIMLGGIYITREYILTVKKNRIDKSDKKTEIFDDFYSFNDIMDIITNYKSRLPLVKNMKINVWINFFCYCLVVISFIIFVILNKGIVVGDKSAHQATIHIPQLFYFALFFCIFGWVFCLNNVFHYLNFLYKHVKTSVVILISFIIIIYYNTLEHPYLLADNRHYTFYLWNKFYRKLNIFRYVMTAVYGLGIFTIYKKLRTTRDISYLLFYIPCVILSLILQRMIEVRYFFIPFLLTRLHFKNVPIVFLIAELISYIIINCAFFYIFNVKNIYWSDYAAPQKLIW